MYYTVLKDTDQGKYQRDENRQPEQKVRSDADTNINNSWKVFLVQPSTSVWVIFEHQGQVAWVTQGNIIMQGNRADATGSKVNWGEKNPTSYSIGVKNVVRFLVTVLYYFWCSYCNNREEKLVFSICSIFNLGVRQLAQKLGWKTGSREKSHKRFLILCGGTCLQMPSRLTVLLVRRILFSSPFFTMQI